MTDQAATTHKEDQLVAALSHAGALVPTFGLLVPLIVWITQKDRSPYLKNQALQAVIWQGFALLIQFVSIGCYFMSMFLFVPLGMFLESDAVYVDPASGGAMAAGLLILFPLVALLFVFFGLVYMGFAIAGILQCLKGKAYQYPFVGRWVSGRLAADEQLQTDAENNNQ